MTTSTQRSIRARLTVAVAMLGASLMFAACGTSEAATTPEQSDAPAASYELRVTDPGNTGWLAVAKRDGTIEAALEPLGATVNWVPNKGAVSANLPLFATGELQVSGGAFTPVIGAAAGNAPIRIGAVFDTEGEVNDSGIVASEASGVKSVEDLVGKSVAVNPAGKGEYIVLRALSLAGIDPDTVSLEYLHPADGLGAFKAGKVDAIATFGEFFRQAQEGATVVTTEYKIDSQDEDIILFTTDLLDERPDVAKAFVEASAPVIARQSQEPEDFVNVFESTGPRAISGDALDWQIAAYRANPITARFPTDADREKLQAVIDLFASRGVIPEGVQANDLIATLG